MVVPWKFSLDRRICSASCMRSVRFGIPSTRWRMLNQSITADVGQKFGSIAIEVSISGAAWPARESASIAASLRMDRSAAGNGEYPHNEPATNFFRPASIWARWVAGTSHPASCEMAST